MQTSFEIDELKVMSLLEEAFRYKYKSLGTYEDKLLLKRQYLTLKLQLKSRFANKSNKKYVAMSFIEKLSCYNIWRENTFLHLWF